MSDPKKDSRGKDPPKAPDPMPVLVAAEQPPIPMMQIAPDGVTPVPIPSLGAEANTLPGESLPVAGFASQNTPPISSSTSTMMVTQDPNQPPMPVIVQNPGKAPRPDVLKEQGITLAPTTTEQQDITTAGQRAINKIWEYTQSAIALTVVISGVLINSIVILFVMFRNAEVSTSQLSLITISLQFINLTTGIIIGFYFSRTNHSAQGGVGPKVADGPYTGR